jgi:hypothetical protein
MFGRLCAFRRRIGAHRHRVPMRPRWRTLRPVSAERHSEGPERAWRPGPGQPAEGRESVVISAEAWEEGTKRARAVTDRLARIPIDDRAMWASAAREGAGVYAALSRRFEGDRPGALAAAADMPTCWLARHTRPTIASIVEATWPTSSRSPLSRRWCAEVPGTGAQVASSWSPSSFAWPRPCSGSTSRGASWPAPGNSSGGSRP